MSDCRQLDFHKRSRAASRLFETGLQHSIRIELGAVVHLSSLAACTNMHASQAVRLSYRAGRAKPCVLARPCLSKRVSARGVRALTQDWNITTRGPVRSADGRVRHISGGVALRCRCAGGRSGRFAGLRHLRRRPGGRGRQRLLVRAQTELSEERKYALRRTPHLSSLL